MNKNIIRTIFGLLALLVLLWHAAGFGKIPLISHLDAIIYDFKLRLTMPGGVDDRIVILDIDEPSLAAYGRWPWSRDRLARLMDVLFDQYHISVLGLDVVFAEPDTSSGLPVLESLASKEFQQDAMFQSVLKTLRPTLDYDHRFVEAVRGRKVILGYYFDSAEGQAASSGAIPPPVLPAGSFTGQSVPIVRYDRYGGNLPSLQQAAAGGGHFNPKVDFDGLVRRVPLLVEFDHQYYESLSLAMVRSLLGGPKVVPWYPEGTSSDSREDYRQLEGIDLGTDQHRLHIPVDENASVLIPYRGRQGSFRYLSLVDVMEGKIAKEALDGRIALLGTSTPGLLDLRATPVGEAYPGVEVHANLVAGILDQSIKNKPPYVVAIEVILLVVLGVVMSLLVPRLKPVMATLVSVAMLLMVIVFNIVAWQRWNLVVPMASTLWLMGILYAFNMSYGYFVESRSKQQFTELFGQYVPPELVEEMSRNPEEYSMAGKNAELTILFSDIRGFTTLSEGLSPETLRELMNEYLSAMTDVIRFHRGTLDKYIGDAIMAFWGAPVDDPQHARDAVVTAMEMQSRVAALNESFMSRGWPPLKIGVGLNTGMVTVGDMGSRVRKAYTVIGDPVNLASRLEGVTKEYGVGIIVGEDTKRAVNDCVFRELDRVQVKGKETAVSIFEPLGLEGAVGRDQLEALKLWNQALRQYRAQDWDQAEVALYNLTRAEPDCKLYKLYMERIAHMRKNPPGSGWNGVTRFETK